MEIRYLPDPQRFARMTTKELRAAFLVGHLFEPDQVHMLYSNPDRAVLGAGIPGKETLTLKVDRAIASDFFLQRREMGIVNLGAAGRISIDGQSYDLARLDMLYVGRGARAVVLQSIDPSNPAEFYWQSYPAHRECPTTLMPASAARQVPLGDPEHANRRTIFQYIRPGLVDSCQLVMGVTILEPGSVWNTLPAHTHERRSEIYLYFGLPDDGRVFHLLGSAAESRHLVVKNKEAVLSPSWSMHAGGGSTSYSFVWGMGGENQEFDDMDFIPLSKMN